jgi:hypothetical protein
MTNVIKLKVEKETAEKLFFIVNHAGLMVLDHLGNLGEQDCLGCSHDENTEASYEADLEQYLKLMRDINAQVSLMPPFLWSGHGFIRDFGLEVN